jgi:hypothetical protein
MLTAGTVEAREFLFAATGKQTALIDPFFADNATVKTQVVINPVDLLVRPRRDLIKVIKAE